MGNEDKFDRGVEEAAPEVEVVEAAEPVEAEQVEQAVAAPAERVDSSGRKLHPWEVSPK